MSDDEQFVEFNAVVEMFDITPRALRYYEYLELIRPKRVGRKRFYSRREIGRIKAILRGRRFGFKLEEIRQYLEMYDPQTGNRAQTEALLGRLDAHIADMKLRRDEIQDVIEELEGLGVAARAHLADLARG